MYVLGERIRTLRKKNKMTLEELAGDQLTKGMLSQIENNKAKPSMESLEYIAKRLGVAITELLEMVSSEELRKVLDEVERNYEESFINYMDNDHTIQTCTNIIELVEPYLSNLTDSYQSARLFEIYSYCLFCLKKEDWLLYWNKAALIYDSLNLTANRAQMGHFKCMTYFITRRFQETLQCFLEEKNHLNTVHIKIDPMTQVSLDYHEAAIYSALGNTKATSEAMQRALTFSRKEKIYYKTDKIYQLAAIEALLGKESDRFNYYLKKLKQYGEFMEDELFIELCDVLYVEYLLHIEGNIQEAMIIIDRYCLPVPGIPEKIAGDNWNMLQKGKALFYGRKYEQALDILQTIFIPAYMNHPVDLAIYYLKDTFLALCHKECGNREKALTYAKMAYDHFSLLPPSIFKKLTVDTYVSLLAD
ncbi:helix-turn-helix transcriptional regulator [Bacillus sp. B1-b2]|nr:helix-turn-helix transcriptional regulator [Bacillus sp. B1-b2]